MKRKRSRTYKHHSASRVAGIQYVGIPGVSADCKDAVIGLLQNGACVSLARILTHSNHHCLLLTVNSGDIVAVKSGFTSGYPGEGPRTLSFVLQLLDLHGADIDEYEVGEDLLSRLDLSALTSRDLVHLDTTHPLRPSRWIEYVDEKDLERSDQGRLWDEFNRVIPFAIIDGRIADLALKFFERPDDCLLTGYRRLEDTIRGRTGLEEHGTKLFARVFNSDMPILTWKKIDRSEHAGRASIFTGAFMAYRNPRAHREPQKYSSELLAEFLLLNHLYLLEGCAVDQKGRRRKPETPMQALRKQLLDDKWKLPRKQVKRVTSV